jgi:glutamate/tyrosine decarboxylase-like PLP-dependent enzyme
MLQLPPESRAALWQRLIEIVEDYAERVDSARVAPLLDPERIRATLHPIAFETGWTPLDAIEFVAEQLWRQQTHTPHPRYFGLYNPAPTTMGIAGDTLVAAFNPQIAAWSHSPFAAEVEAHLVRSFGRKFGYAARSIDGVFCSGGAEANHTAVLTALNAAHPNYATGGVRALPAQPVLYASAECHHSFLKAARVCGIGVEAVRKVPVDEGLKLDTEALSAMIATDRQNGLAPFLVAGTAGTTNAGVIDPLQEIAAIAEHERLWFHADAAWGGAAALSPDLRHHLAGIDRADSITFDAHKWLSAPMGAGVYVTRHPSILTKTFATPTAYMPKDAKGLPVTDPHLHSMQWSRRFTGLKVFLSLLVAGWDGYAAAIDHMTAMGDLLRSELAAAGCEIVNRTPLPVVCFLPPKSEPVAVARAVVDSGDAWISTTRLASRNVLRACITNYNTTADDIHALVELILKASCP